MASNKLGFRAVGEMKPLVGLKNGISTAQCRKRTEWQRKRKLIRYIGSKWEAESTKVGSQTDSECKLDWIYISENKT